jgi:hypothetical protein
MTRRGVIEVATVLSLLSGRALAQVDPTWPALMSIGMNGTWAIDCSKAASSTNGRLTYYLGADNRVWRKYDRGPGTDSLNITIDSAHLASPTTIQVRIRNDDPNWGSMNGVVVDAVVEIINNHMRTLDSTMSDGTQVVKDGVVVKGGTHMPIIEKCSN